MSLELKPGFEVRTRLTAYGVFQARVKGPKLLEIPEIKEKIEQMKKTKRKTTSHT